MVQPIPEEGKKLLDARMLQESCFSGPGKTTKFELQSLDGNRRVTQHLVTPILKVGLKKTILKQIVA